MTAKLAKLATAQKHRTFEAFHGAVLAAWHGSPSITTRGEQLNLELRWTKPTRVSWGRWKRTSSTSTCTKAFEYLGEAAAHAGVVNFSPAIKARILQRHATSVERDDRTNARDQRRLIPSALRPITSFDAGAWRCGILALTAGEEVYHTRVSSAASPNTESLGTR